VTAQVIMVDFPDAPARLTPAAAFRKVSSASKLFSEMSFGKFNYRMIPTKKWYRMSKISSEYMGSDGFSFEEHRNYISEALTLADKDINFSSTDSFIVLANPEAEGMGFQGPAFAPLAGDGLVFDGRYLGNGATSAFDLNNWGAIWVNHEISHTLGLIDLYAYESQKHGGNAFPFTGEFSYMGLSSLESNAPSLLAFERWNLGWISDSQVSCMTGKSMTKLVTPVQRKLGLKAVVIPISDTKAVVVESRRRIGIDKRLAKSGALVYLVDSSVESGMGAVQVFPRNLKNDPRFLRSPRAVGESVTIEGVTVKVLKSSASGDTVQITKP
jgi:M6 family metalloprotease-like protein